MAETVERTLTVTGLGKVTLHPNQTEISITIEARDKDYHGAADKQQEKTMDLKNAIAEVGFDISKIKSAGFGVQVDYENVQNENGVWERKFAGYVCTHELSLKFDYDSEKLKWIISAITSCKKAAPIFDIAFTVKDREKATDKLLEAAVKDAIKKANVLSAAAGVSLGKLVSMKYDRNDVEFYSPTRSHTLLLEKNVGTPRAATDLSVVPDDIHAEATVVAVWEIID